jgi:hypothetical protein
MSAPIRLAKVFSYCCHGSIGGAENPAIDKNYAPETQKIENLV